MDLNKLMNFKWGSLQKYASPQASEDLNRFLEQMPQNVGQTLLVIAAVVWCLAGASGLYATIQLKEVTKLRGEFESAQALQPSVPKLTRTAVSSKYVGAMAETLSEVYKGLKVNARGSEVTITASSTGYFGQFREALSHLQNGGDGWKLDIKELCVGRECKRNHLYAVVKINKVSVK